MAWAKLDDGIYDNPKTVGLSDRAFRLYINGIAYCARHLTDGNIPAAKVRALRGTPRTVQELIESGLWHINGTGYIVNDYLVYNFTREQVETRRAKDAKRLADWRARKAKKR